MKTTTRESIDTSVSVSETGEPHSVYGSDSEHAFPHHQFEELTQLAALVGQVPIAFLVFPEGKHHQIIAAYGADKSSLAGIAAWHGSIADAESTALVVTDLPKKILPGDLPSHDFLSRLAFFAALPLKSSEGAVIGSLVLADTEPNQLTDAQQSGLKTVAAQVCHLAELNNLRCALLEKDALISSKHHDLEYFANMAAHDLKAPLSNISGLIDVMLTYYSGKLDQNVSEMLELIRDSSTQLRLLVDGILAFGKNNQHLAAAKETTHLPTFFRTLNNMVDPENQYRVLYNSDDDFIEINAIAMQHILAHLLTNAIRYNDKPQTEISVEVSTHNDRYMFVVSDNGPGIAPENITRIFNIFEIVALQDRFGLRGCGIGLASVKRLVEGQKGSIAIDSQPGKGSRFEVSIPV